MRISRKPFIRVSLGDILPVKKKRAGSRYPRRVWEEAYYMLYLLHVLE